MKTYILKIKFKETHADSCTECPLLKHDDDRFDCTNMCKAENRFIKNHTQRPEWCPLEEVKDKDLQHDDFPEGKNI